MSHESSLVSLPTWGQLLEAWSALMHQSIPAVPIPPPYSGNPRGICSSCQCGVGAFAILSRPGGWALAYPGATRGHAIHHHLKCLDSSQRQGELYLVYQKTITDVNTATSIPGAGHLPSFFVPTPGH